MISLHVVIPLVSSLPADDGEKTFGTDNSAAIVNAGSIVRSTSPKKSILPTRGSTGNSLTARPSGVNRIGCSFGISFPAVAPFSVGVADPNINFSSSISTKP